MNLEEEMFNLNGGFYGFKSKRQMEEHYTIEGIKKSLLDILSHLN